MQITQVNMFTKSKTIHVLMIFEQHFNNTPMKKKQIQVLQNFDILASDRN